MKLTNTIKFVSFKDTFIKSAILTVAATIAIMFGTVGQASAWSLRYENTTYSFSAQAGGLYCNFNYVFGEFWGVAYGKVKNVGYNTQCNFGVQVHTPGAQPAGGSCWTFYNVLCNSSQLSQGWYQSQSVGGTQHYYTDVVVYMGQAPYRHFFNFTVYSNLTGNTSHGYTYDGNAASYCGYEPNLTGEDNCPLL